MEYHDFLGRGGEWSGGEGREQWDGHCHAAGTVRNLTAGSQADDMIFLGGEGKGNFDFKKLKIVSNFYIHKCSQSLVMLSPFGKRKGSVQAPTFKNRKHGKLRTPPPFPDWSIYPSM